MLFCIKWYCNQYKKVIVTATRILYIDRKPWNNPIPISNESSRLWWHLWIYLTRMSSNVSASKNDTSMLNVRTIYLITSNTYCIFSRKDFDDGRHTSVWWWLAFLVLFSSEWTSCNKNKAHRNFKINPAIIHSDNLKNFHLHHS